MRDILEGFLDARGYGVVTDGGGDKAMFVWTCKAKGPRCEGDAQWAVGTGRYSGLKGNSTFHGEPVPTNSPEASSGYAVLKGQWQLPE